MLIDLPEPVNITVHQGDSFERTLRIRNEEQEPIDLTGDSVELNISAARGRSPSWSWKDHVNRAQIIDAANGLVRIGILEDTTAEFGSLSELAYDVTLEHANGRRTTIMSGTLRVRHQARRPQ